MLGSLVLIQLVLKVPGGIGLGMLGEEELPNVTDFDVAGVVDCPNFKALFKVPWLGLSLFSRIFIEFPSRRRTEMLLRRTPLSLTAMVLCLSSHHTKTLRHPRVLLCTKPNDVLPSESSSCRTPTCLTLLLNGYVHDYVIVGGVQLL